MSEPTQVRLKLLEESNNRRLANTKILGIKTKGMKRLYRNMTTAHQQ
jgi:hypothetical protein